MAPPRVQSSLGSGVITDPSGIIVTNNHVIRDADTVKVALSDGREFDSKVLLKDESDRSRNFEDRCRRAAAVLRIGGFRQGRGR